MGGILASNLIRSDNIEMEKGFIAGKGRWAPKAKNMKILQWEGDFKIK